LIILYRQTKRTTSPSFNIRIKDGSIDRCKLIVGYRRPDIPKRKSWFVKTVRLEWHSVVRRGMHRHDAWFP